MRNMNADNWTEAPIVQSIQECRVLSEQAGDGVPFRRGLRSLRNAIVMSKFISQGDP